MNYISVKNLGVTYKLRQKLSLFPRPSYAVKGNQSRISGSGRMRYVEALKDVSFDLQMGDRLGLVGSNGSGKSTLLKSLYGIYAPTAGAIEISGRVDALFNINLGFRPEASGRDNIILRGLINGLDHDAIDEKMEEIIEFSALGDFIDMPFKTYSQGMAARLAFATATAHKPEILLMDEWIGAGDKNFQDQARRRISDLVAGAGIVVLASHNHLLLKRICNKMLRLENGRIVDFDSTENFFNRDGDLI